MSVINGLFRYIHRFHHSVAWTNETQSQNVPDGSWSLGRMNPKIIIHWTWQHFLNLCLCVCFHCLTLASSLHVGFCRCFRSSASVIHTEMSHWTLQLFANTHWSWYYISADELHTENGINLVLFGQVNQVYPVWLSHSHYLNQQTYHMEWGAAPRLNLLHRSCPVRPRGAGRSVSDREVYIPANHFIWSKWNVKEQM